jgi:hypothetical protein
MKKSVFLILLILATFQVVASGQKKGDRFKVKADTVSVDSIEYRLVVLDPGFETWLAAKPSKDFYSKEYYELKNRLYVIEWNQRYMSSRNSGLYDTYIDYNPRIDYGLDLNYRLYYYFLYFEETNHVRLLNTSR